MSTSTLHPPLEHPTTTTRGTPERNQPIRLGTFADGQRDVDVTATYSPGVGSFGHVERK
ncbi:MAG: hypothetical protein JO363_11435 [Solirubrobacterales bacterium]|nr:hypothetical protein [Solirubrobacterales bacterium]